MDSRFTQWELLEVAGDDVQWECSYLRINYGIGHICYKKCENDRLLVSCFMFFHFFKLKILASGIAVYFT